MSNFAYVSKLNGYLLKDAEAREQLEKREGVFLELATDSGNYDDIFELVSDENGKQTTALNKAIKRFETSHAPVVVVSVKSDGTKVFYNYVGHNENTQQAYFYSPTDHEIIGIVYAHPYEGTYIYHYPLNAFYLKEDYDEVNEALNIAIAIGHADDE